MKRLVAVLACVAIVMPAGCARVREAAAPAQAGAAEVPAKGDAVREVDPRLAGANDAFGLRLLRQMPASGPNALLSPFSVTSALAMTANGADGAARTAIARTLGIDAMGMPAANAAYADLLARLQTDTPVSKLAIANSLWLREGEEFRSDFLATNRDYYAAEATTVRFGGIEANRRIDGWVNARTRGLIPRLLGDQPLDERTLLVLVNALYFKSDWKDAFDPAETRPETFTAPGSSFEVPMMHKTAALDYLETPRFRAVRLPYEDGKRSMYVFVPRYAGAERLMGGPVRLDTLDLFLDELDGASWAEWMRSFQRREDVIVGLPRMTLKGRCSLKQPLERLGIGPAFRPGGFPRLTKSGDEAAIADVVHAVTVEVDEKGTKAAAATGVVVGATAMPVEPPRVVADRPFFFAIRDDASGVVLFAGAVRDPRK